MNGPSSETTPKILVVEDERNLAEGISENLRLEGYSAEIAGDGATALERILGGEFSLVILDVMLPKMDGFTVCEEVRKRDRKTPILFLTAKGGINDRIRGLEAGGDDYLPKPFHLKELLLRVGTILRRWEWYGGSETPADTLNFADNEIDFRTFEARAWNGRSHSLSHKEAMILKVLAERPDEVVPREDLLDRVWGYDVFPSTRTVEQFVVRLREKFEPEPDRPRHLHTVRGVGYRFSPKGGEHD